MLVLRVLVATLWQSLWLPCLRLSDRLRNSLCALSCLLGAKVDASTALPTGAHMPLVSGGAWQHICLARRLVLDSGGFHVHRGWSGCRATRRPPLCLLWFAAALARLPVLVAAACRRGSARSILGWTWGNQRK